MAIAVLPALPASEDSRTVPGPLLETIKQPWVLGVLTVHDCPLGSPGEATERPIKTGIARFCPTVVPCGVEFVRKLPVTTVSDRVVLATCGVGVPESVTVIGTLYVPAVPAAGVPLITPVVWLIESPNGKPLEQGVGEGQTGADHE
jgi:hypothetical protein